MPELLSPKAVPVIVMRALACAPVPVANRLMIKAIWHQKFKITPGSGFCVSMRCPSLAARWLALVAQPIIRGQLESNYLVRTISHALDHDCGREVLDAYP